MKTSLKNTLLALSLAFAAGSAEAVVAASTGGMRVAVVDREAVLLSTDAAKVAQDKLNAEMKPQRDKLELLRREIKGLEERFQKESATMAEREKKVLRDQADAKASEFNILIQQVQKRTQDAQQELLNRLLPSLQAVMDDLRKTGNYDVILDRRSVIYVNPDLDLTKRVIDRLNAAR